MLLARAKLCQEIITLTIAIRFPIISLMLYQRMTYKVQPWKHQLEAISKAETSDELALFFDMGTGKTATTINILRLQYNKNKKIMKTLIFAPLVVCENWGREFELHSKIPSANILVLNKSGKKRLKDFDDNVNDNTIIVTNYEALRTAELFKRLEKWQPEILVCDESHLCKNPQANQSKKVEKLSRTTRHRYILTGTPILNSALDVFQQFRILDGGKTFGKNYYVFRDRYFKDANSQWSGRPGYFPKWEPRTNLYPELNAKIFAKALRVTKDECLDLPPLIKQTVTVEMNAKQKKAYKEMERDLVTYIKDNKDKPQAVIAELAVTKALRLQQITTGFVTTEDEDLIDFGEVPRLKELKELLQTITHLHKCIVWCSFRHNYKQVSKVCDALELPHVFLTGEMSAAKKQEAMDEFNNDSKCKVMIANRRAGGIGVNLVSASYSIVYSRNFSLNEELQSEARNYRKGCEIHDKITKIDLVAKDSIDARVMEALAGKEKTSDQIIGWYS
jgi:SNF2 family DNA or RNA helicase